MSALYPAPSPAATAWLATLRAALASLAGQVRHAAPIDPETLAARVSAPGPGPSSVGVRVEKDGKTIRRSSEYMIRDVRQNCAVNE